MPNLALRSAILAACFTAAACTDEHATTPAAPAVESGSPAAAAPELAPAPTLSARTTSLEGLSVSPFCALDYVNGVLAADGSFAATSGQPITFDGWVATLYLKNPGTFKIILDGQSDFEIAHVTGVARKDVADAHQSADLEHAGFRTELPALDVPAGQYAVMLGHESEGDAFACKTNLSLIVSQ